MSATWRESIQWGDNSPSEPTDTVVLTVNKKYVDIRILKEFKDPRFSLQWGFCGETITKPVSDPPNSVYVEFTHQVDSNDVVEPDGGYMTQIDEVTERETGQMRNPDSGQVEPYIEIWKSFDLSANARTLVAELVLDDKLMGRVITVDKYSQGVAKIDDEFHAFRKIESDIVWSLGSINVFPIAPSKKSPSGLEWEYTD